MEENKTANNPEQPERSVNPYSAKAVKRALGRKRCGELLILFVFMLFFYGPLIHACMLAFANVYQAGDVVPSEWGSSGGLT